MKKHADGMTQVVCIVFEFLNISEIDDKLHAFGFLFCFLMLFHTNLALLLLQNIKRGSEPHDDQKQNREMQVESSRTLNAQV